MPIIFFFHERRMESFDIFPILRIPASSLPINNSRNSDILFIINNKIPRMQIAVRHHDRMVVTKTRLYKFNTARTAMSFAKEEIIELGFVDNGARAFPKPASEIFAKRWISSSEIPIFRWDGKSSELRENRV